MIVMTTIHDGMVSSCNVLITGALVGDVANYVCKNKLTTESRKRLFSACVDDGEVSQLINITKLPVIGRKGG